VEVIDNKKTDINLKPILNRLTAKLPYEKNESYFWKNTAAKEIQLFNKITLNN